MSNVDYANMPVCQLPIYAATKVRSSVKIVREQTQTHTRNENKKKCRKLMNMLNNRSSADDDDGGDEDDK